MNSDNERGEKMREYRDREEAERDQELDLQLNWECDKCGATRSDYPGCNEGGLCSCGGEFQYAGESYNA